MLPATAAEYTLGTDPELRFTPSGMAVLSVRAVASSRKKDEAGNWADDKSAWVTLTAFRQLAENIAESGLAKGDKVVAIGRLEIQEWEDKDGNKRSTPAILLDSLGPSLAFATATVKKAERSGGSGGGGSSQTTRSNGTPADDPYYTGPAPQTDEPPF